MKYLFILIAFLLLTSGAFAGTTPPVTTFSSFQVPNTTDQNITLTCTDDNTGCKTINYNINGLGWNQITNQTLDQNSPEGTLQFSAFTNWTKVKIHEFNPARISLVTNQLNRNPATAQNYDAKYIYYYTDGTTEDSNINVKSGSTSYQTFSYSLPTANKDVNKAELWVHAHGTSTDYGFWKDSNIYLVPQTNSYSFLFSGAGSHSIQYFSTDNADNNETIKTSQFPQFTSANQPTQSRLALYGVSQYNGYAVTSWLWKSNGTTIGTDQNLNYSTQANLDLNICLTTNNTDTTCRQVKTWDTINPTINASVTNSVFGFVDKFDINYSLTCYDNFTPIRYLITANDLNTTTTIYDSSDANASTVTGTYSIPSKSSAIITMSCIDDSNNTATYTSQRLYAVFFSLINEATGAKLTWADLNTNLNIARVYTPDGNYSFDFNSSVKSDVNFFSPSSSLYFEFGYKDTGLTKISRQIDFGLIDDSNIGVCVPFYQTFYQQRFVANSPRQMVLQNNVSKCYVVVGTLDYVYDTGYSITTYTIPKPYYLYIWVNGVKTFLALIDGAVATQYNLDAIAFSRTAFDIVVGQDTVGFAPLINTVTNAYDTNTLQIYYKSFTEDNSQIDLTIKNGDSIIWNYVESTSPNELLINFYWGGLGISDQNVLELVVQTTDAGGSTTTKSYYFTVYGNYYPNEGANGWVVIIAGLFFLFGITLVAAGRAFGIFGVIICVICLAITGIASGAWWISLMQAIFLICLMYIIMMGKTTMGQLG